MNLEGMEFMAIKSDGLFGHHGLHITARDPQIVKQDGAHGGHRR